VTQYANWPAKSGVQRVLHRLASEWSGNSLDARFGFLGKRGYATGPIRAFADVIGATFCSRTAGAPSAKEIQAQLRKVADGTVAADRLDREFDGYLLPEPSFRSDSLATAERMGKTVPARSFFIYYDALPLTHPQFFYVGADRIGALPRYHQVVAESENVAFISEATRRVFERRVARRTLARAIVSRPGADGLGTVPGGARIDPVPTFAVVGTVEPRKGHRVVLDAFEELWASGRDYRLLVLGAPGSERPELLDRLRMHADSPRLEWFTDATDGDVASALARSWGMIFVPVAEGYGLPPLEALAAGCPTIVPSDLPALEDLPDQGQIRLERVTASSVAAAIETLADEQANLDARRAVRQLRLPTWRRFAAEIEAWMASILAGGNAGSRLVDARTEAPSPA
jgi:glycosyltransferase involved in cell wall biosynthesis